MTDADPRYDRLDPERDDAPYTAMIRAAFGDDGEPGLIPWYRGRLGDDNVRVLRRGDDLAACLTLIPMAQFFGDARVPSVGIAALTVAPAHRGTGASAALLRAMLDEARERGFALSVLYASTLPVYRKAGFELAGSWVRYAADPAGLVRARSPLRLTRIAIDGAGGADDADRATLHGLQHTAARRGNGPLERPGPLWSFKLAPWRDAVDGHLIHGTGDGGEAAEGYVLASRKRNDRCDLLDWCALTADAARQVLTFLADTRSVCGTVTWIGGPEDPLAYLAADRSRLRLDRFERWLLRVVDAAAALEARGYPPDLEAALALEVRDPTLPWNDGRLLLEIADGRGRASRRDAPSGVPAVALDARALAALYTGYLTPYALRDLGALAAGDERALALAAAAFAAGPRPWMADDF